MDFKEVSKAILNAKKIGLTFHTSPDGDAIGSTLAVLNGLRELGKDSYIVSREVIPDNLSFLPLGNEIDGNTPSPVDDTDLVIVLDCGNVDRICADLTEYDGDIINIDHHVTNENYGKLNYVDPEAAATCELSLLLLESLGIIFDEKDETLARIGSCIYTGIVTDTGSFRHSNVTERTHAICSKLIACGVDNNIVHKNLFDNRPFNKVKLMGDALSSIELLCNNKVAFIEFTMDQLASYELESTDTSDVINIALSIKGVEVAVITKEVEDGVKASLRSKNNADVRRVAETLGGGGHIKAAGLKVVGSTLKEVKEKLISEIEKEI